MRPSERYDQPVIGRITTRAIDLTLTDGTTEVLGPATFDSIAVATVHSARIYHDPRSAPSGGRSPRAGE